jgi:hypothetical protein
MLGLRPKSNDPLFYEGLNRVKTRQIFVVELWENFTVYSKFFFTALTLNMFIIELKIIVKMTSSVVEWQVQGTLNCAYFRLILIAIDFDLFPIFLIKNLFLVSSSFFFSQIKITTTKNEKIATLFRNFSRNRTVK